MDNKINSTTPEEIKARIDYCRNVKTAGDCMSCPYGEDADVCASDFMFDSFDYMQYLESELAEARKDVDMLGEQVAALDGAYNAMKRERDAAVRTARWQFERRGKDGVTELPVCSGCGATPKYYAPKNDVGMQVPPYCHECGSKMAAVVKMEATAHEKS